MKNIFFLTLSILFLSSCGWEYIAVEETEGNPSTKKEWALVLHGGAGTIEPDRFTSEQKQAYGNSLEEALRIGERILRKGGAAMDAVEAVIVYLENDSLFNAGKGAVLTYEGHTELDASIMDGKSLNCGAVTGIQNIKNPIQAARLVMDSSDHVFFSGPGATRFALEQGLEWVDSLYFITEKRMESYLRNKEKYLSSHRIEKEWKYGTVGCVALDKNGDLAAGTSTGGMNMKKHGRIGDSPMIGAGTYADNRSCGVSCTGWGEYFIRAAVAHDVHARMLYGDRSLVESASEVIQEVIPDLGGNGGLIAIDQLGNIEIVFNTSGMFRACSDSEGRRELGMFSSKH